MDTWWPKEPTEEQKAEERELEDRRLLIEHIRWELLHHYPVALIDQLAEAIELAASGENEAWIEVDRRAWPVAELVEFWWLDEFVERTKAGEFKPRRGSETWRREPPPDSDPATGPKAA